MVKGIQTSPHQQTSPTGTIRIQSFYSGKLPTKAPEMLSAAWNAVTQGVAMQSYLSLSCLWRRHRLYIEDDKGSHV